MTFFTIFCSSIRKARTTRSLTQFAQRDPPYARWTVLVGLETWEYSRGRRAGTCGTSVSYCLFVGILTRIFCKRVAAVFAVLGYLVGWL